MVNGWGGAYGTISLAPRGAASSARPRSTSSVSNAFHRLPACAQVPKNANAVSATASRLAATMSACNGREPRAQSQAALRPRPISSASAGVTMMARPKCGACWLSTEGANPTTTQANRVTASGLRQRPANTPAPSAPNAAWGTSRAGRPGRLCTHCRSPCSTRPPTVLKALSSSAFGPVLSAPSKVVSL